MLYKQKLVVNFLFIYMRCINRELQFFKSDISGCISRNRFMHIAREIDDNRFSHYFNGLSANLNARSLIKFAYTGVYRANLNCCTVSYAMVFYLNALVERFYSYHT